MREREKSVNKRLRIITWKKGIFLTTEIVTLSVFEWENKYVCTHGLVSEWSDIFENCVCDWMSTAWEIKDSNLILKEHWLNVTSKILVTGTLIY